MKKIPMRCTLKIIQSILAIILFIISVIIMSKYTFDILYNFQFTTINILFVSIYTIILVVGVVQFIFGLLLLRAYDIIIAAISFISIIFFVSLIVLVINMFFIIKRYHSLKNNLK